MKKIFLLLVLSFSLLTIANAQYTVLVNFNAPGTPDAEEPHGSITLAGGKFYGMSYYGGPNSNGNVFSVDTDGNNFKDIYDFNSAYSYPEGGGDLIVLRDLIYGTADAGGTFPSDNGYIFCMDTNGSGFRDLFDFDGTDGLGPISLKLCGSKFYGMTEYGGSKKCGVIFSIDTNGKNYKALLNLDTVSSGYNSWGGIILSGTKLYGMTRDGGMYSDGCLFSIDTNGNEYQKFIDFNGTDGSLPYGSLSLIGNVLCGTTSQGGSNGYGVIFSIDTNGNGFADLFDFDALYGVYPSGVINIGNTLYGMAQEGGANSEGVLFRYKQTGLGLNNLVADTREVNIYPNPSNGIFTLSFSHLVPIATGIVAEPQIEIYNVMGQKVLTEILRSAQNDNTINISSQPNGIYLYRVLSENGELIGEGKVVIQK